MKRQGPHTYISSHLHPSSPYAFLLQSILKAHVWTQESLECPSLYPEAFALGAAPLNEINFRILVACWTDEEERPKPRMSEASRR